MTSICMLCKCISKGRLIHGNCLSCSTKIVKANQFGKKTYAQFIADGETLPSRLNKSQPSESAGDESVDDSHKKLAPKRAPAGSIALKNGLYSTHNFRFKDLAPGDTLADAAKFAYVPRATTPYWDDFCASYLSPKGATIIQRWLGAAIDGSTRFNRPLFVYGERLSIRSLMSMFDELFFSLGVDEVESRSLGALLSRGVQKTAAKGKGQRRDRLAIVRGFPSRRGLDRLVDVLASEPRTLLCPMFYAFFDDDKPRDEEVWRLRPLKVRVQPTDEVWGELRDELSGIFNWAMKGLADLRMHGWEVK